MTYSLTLTEAEYEAICFVGERYCWSETCRNLLAPGENLIEEHDAWAMREAIELDTEGGHAPFPMLGDDTLLAKLVWFWQNIV